MNLSPLQRRQARKGRHQTMVDMNLVSLIDVFTILIFFLLSSAGVDAALPSAKTLELPLASVEQQPKDTWVVVVSEQEILVEGRSLARVAEVLADPADTIAPLQAELERLAQRKAVRAENAADAKAVTLVADKNIPYRLLRKVMATSAKAGFTDVSFAVQKRNDV